MLLGAICLDRATAPGLAILVLPSQEPEWKWANSCPRWPLGQAPRPILGKSLETCPDWTDFPVSVDLAQSAENKKTPPKRGLLKVYYLMVTLPPAASRTSFALSATSFLTFSRTGFGAPSTRSFASLRPRLVKVRTSLIT
ncbi:MAG: hypothetical protein RIS09_1002 [Actinomycetota bacterium]